MFSSFKYKVDGKEKYQVYYQLSTMWKFESTLVTLKQMKRQLLNYPNLLNKVTVLLL